MPTPSLTIQIAELSQALALIEIKKQGLYGGGIDLKLPRKLFNIRRSIEERYNLNPSDTTLQGTSNYLYALCAPFNIRAEYILSITNGGGTVTPITPTDEVPTPITISGANFANTTDWEYAPYAGKNVTVFSNGIARYLTYLTEWIYIPTGIRITIDQFDSSQMDYTMVITIIR